MAVVNEREQLSRVLPGYELADEIGRGGWGVVYAATHRTLGRRVAIKYLPAAFLTDSDARDRFRAEARVVASLDHPHIVPLFDFVEQDDTCVFIMEQMPGGTLWDRFTAGDLGLESACNVALALLGALQHAHDRDVLHRDIKPENVLFNAEGLPKLADFGIAKVLGDGAGTRTATGTIMGTPAYMAPEQGSGAPVGPGTDLYAVAAMLYELLSGRLPFESSDNPLAQLYRHIHEPPPDLRAVAPDVPDRLAAVVMRGLEKAPEDRYPDASAFAAALNEAVTGARGSDWPTRSAIPVLASRELLGHTVGTADPVQPSSQLTTDSALPPPTSQPDTSSSGWAPPAGHRAPEALAPPPSGAAPSAAGASPPHSSGTPSPAAPSPHGPGHSPGRRRGVLITGVAAAVVLTAVILGVIVVASGDDPQQPELAAEEEVSPAAIDRFRGACDANDVPPQLCECALELTLEELTVAQFMENDELLRETGDGLTAEVLERFSRCERQ